ncbi:MAG: hypothetical protein HZA54_15130 [Planctomycetes bacterium]|nr:hypothetical protein [Planctomycetota bacterium]
MQPSPRRGVPVVGVGAACAALFLFGSMALAQEKYRPIRLSIGVKGLTMPDTRDRLVKALKALDGVDGCSTEPEKVLVQLRAERTLRLAQVIATVKALSTPEKPLVVDVEGVVLADPCRLTLTGLGGAKDEGVLAALKAAPNVDKVEKVEAAPAAAAPPPADAPPGDAPPADGAAPAPAVDPGAAPAKPKDVPTRWSVTFLGAKGAKIGEIVGALKSALGVAEGGPVPAVADVAWTAPKRPVEKRPTPSRPPAGGSG